MYLLHPTGLPKLSFGSNCNPRQHLINTKKSTFIFLLSSLPPIQCCRIAKSPVPRCVSRSYINIKWRERVGGLQTRYICFSHDCGFKKQKHLFNISRMRILILLILLILNMLILKLKFWFNLGKLKKWPISLPNIRFGYLKGVRFKYRLYFCSFCV